MLAFVSTLPGVTNLDFNLHCALPGPMLAWHRDIPFFFSQVPINSRADARACFLFMRATPSRTQTSLHCTVLLLAASTLVISMTQTTVTSRFVCMGCESRCMFHKSYPSVKAAKIHVNRHSPACKAAFGSSGWRPGVRTPWLAGLVRRGRRRMFGWYPVTSLRVSS